MKYTREVSTLYFVKGLRLEGGLYVFVETKNGSEDLIRLSDHAMPGSCGGMGACDGV